MNVAVSFVPEDTFVMEQVSVAQAVIEGLLRPSKSYMLIGYRPFTLPCFMRILFYALTLVITYNFCL